MSGDPNPMLLVPGQESRVEAIKGFTAPLPVSLQRDPNYYRCSMLNHHMHRTDGKRLAFVHGILQTRDLFDIAYMEQQLVDGVPFIRKATLDEIRTHQMRTDPRGTMEKELRPEIEADSRLKLQAELKAALETKMNSIGSLSEEQREELAKVFEPSKDMRKDQVSDRDSEFRKEGEQQAAGTSGTSDTEKLSGADLLASLRAKKAEGVNMGGGTMMPLGGISGTDKMPNAGDSNSSDGGTA